MDTVVKIRLIYSVKPSSHKDQIKIKHSKHRKIDTSKKKKHNGVNYLERMPEMGSKLCASPLFKLLAGMKKVKTFKIFPKLRK